MMKVSETPEGKVALEFSKYVVESNYEQAVTLLSESARNTWSADSIQKDYLQMIEYFEGYTPIINTDYMMETFSDNVGKYIYVPLEGDIASEAIIVGVNEDKQIFSIEWGRP